MRAERTQLEDVVWRPLVFHQGEGGDIKMVGIDALYEDEVDTNLTDTPLRQQY